MPPHEENHAPDGERLAALEERSEATSAELARLRERVHSLQSRAAAVDLLAQRLDHVATSLDQLAGDMRTLTRRAVGRPTPAALSAAASWGSLLVALVALLVATTHH